MELLLKRTHPKEKYCIGDLYVNGELFCNTLEDTVRDKDKDGKNEVKIWGQTAIPYGRYQIIIAWSPKFKIKLPLLLNVPGFEGVEIHPGNTIDDTLGCILVGKNTIPGEVHESKDTFNKLMGLIEDIKDPFEKIFITIE